MVTKRKKKRKQFKTILFYIFFGSGCLLIASFLFVTNLNIHNKRQELSARIEILTTEVKRLEERNTSLKESAAYVETEDYLEEVARNQLDMKKPGEEVLVIQKEETEKKPEEEQKESWWDKIKSFWRD